MSITDNVTVGLRLNGLRDRRLLAGAHGTIVAHGRALG